MDELSEDERNTVLYNGASKAQNRFDFDDAFTDTDEDNSVSFDFSPALVREEMARSMKEEWNVDHDLDAIATSIEYAADPDASVSTFDINGSPDGEPISLSSLQSPQAVARTLSQSRSDSFNEVQLSSEFSSVSLSDNPSSSTPIHESPEAELDEPEEHVSPYPAVQIDMSRDHQVTQVITVAPTSMDEPPMATPEPSSDEPFDARRSSNHSRRSSASTPPSSLSTSASSPMPTTPTTAQSNASTVSVGSKYRVTKSTGPSALDKVISKTRPKFLPPKDRREDSKHMADWEVMMKRSRAAGMSCIYSMLVRCTQTNTWIHHVMQ